MNKYVSEFLEENGKSIHYEEVTTGTARPIAAKQKEQSTPPLSSLFTIVVPTDQRKWKDIPAVDYVDEGSLSFSVLEINPNTTTSSSSSRNRWSNGMEHFVTNVMSRLWGSPRMDELTVDRSSA